MNAQETTMQLRDEVHCLRMRHREAAQQAEWAARRHGSAAHRRAPRMLGFQHACSKGAAVHEGKRMRNVPEGYTACCTGAPCRRGRAWRARASAPTRSRQATPTGARVGTRAPRRRPQAAAGPPRLTGACAFQNPWGTTGGTPVLHPCDPGMPARPGALQASARSHSTMLQKSSKQAAT